MRRANATGTASISGNNVTARYPGERSNNWTLLISVSSDIPGEDAASGRFITGTQFDWTAPHGLIGSANSSYTLPPVCVDELGLSDGEGFGLASGANNSNSNNSASLQMRFGNESHERGNFIAYDNAIRQVWVVVTGFAETGRDDGKPRESAGQPGNVACIQANEIQQKSRSFDNSAATALFSWMRIWASVLVAVALT
ncbi:hypothetical protein J3F83DRAFT_765073 [Trichoderma novae-zelandiae]